MQLSKTLIVEFENKLIEGIKTGNIELLNNLLHDDLLFMAPGGAAITKAMDLASHAAGNMVVESLNPHLEQINIIGNTAVVTIVYDTKGTMLGTPVEGKFRYIRIWKLVNNHLQVIAGACFQV